MTTKPIPLNPSSITRVLAASAVLLAMAGAAGQLTAFLTPHDNAYGLVRLFNLDAEQNIPTFFSSSLLLFAALLLAVWISTRVTNRSINRARRRAAIEIAAIDGTQDGIR